MQNQPLQDMSPGDIEIIHQFDTLPGMSAEVTADGLDALLNQPQVAAVALDMPVQSLLSESSVFINVDDVRQTYGFSGKGVNLAVLDTGIDTTHPDLAGSVIAQQCFNKNSTCLPNDTTTSSSAQDENGHGTHVSGVIASQGQNSPQGIAPDTGIVAVRVLDGNGAGYTSDVLAGIDWILNNQDSLNVKIINLSLGGGSYSGICDETDANTQLYAAAVNAAKQVGITIFAASGNDGKSEEMVAPACVGGIVAVGNVYDADLPEGRWPTCTDTNVTANQVACSSNSSSALDLLAPGVSINSTRLGGGQSTESGTSIASPHAAAVAALMLQANPDLNPMQIETVLKETGVASADPRNNRTTPRIDALAAVSAVAMTSVIQITGTVQLEGRTIYSDTSIFVGSKACPTAGEETAAATTNINGNFELMLSANQNTGCLLATHAGYLSAQVNLPIEDLGTTTLLAGDLNDDGEINIFDLTTIATHYGSSNTLADINVSGQVDIFDLVLVAKNFQRQGPVDWHNSE